MSPEKKEEILKWFEKADHDIIAVHKEIDIPPIILDIACFHCQQAVEKYLKSYLVYQGKDIKKTHNLRLLRNLCAEYDSDFESIDFKNLNAYSIELRYPADAIAPPLEEVREYLKIAESVKELVRCKIVLD